MFAIRRLAPRVHSVVRSASTKFTKSHEFIRLDGDIGVVGITEHAAKALGDVVFVDLPNVGKKLEAGDSFGSVESVKAASDVYSPVSGEVVGTNGDLADTPGKVNESPYEKGWFIKIKVDSNGKTQFAKLLDEKAYKTHLESEKH
jgi:glycine cleavage system H protein